MKTLYTVEAISKGGRSGTIQATARPLYIPLGNPLEEAHVCTHNAYPFLLRGSRIPRRPA